MNPGPDRVVETDKRDAQLSCGLDNIGDLLRMGAADGPGQNGPVLGKEVNGPSIHFTVSSHHPVCGLPLFRHAEVGGLGLGQHELLNKTPRVKEPFNSLSRRELALAVLFGGRLGITLNSFPFELGEFLFYFGSFVCHNLGFS